ncbi:MAG: ADP-ribosylglycohydrolase family protein [Algoriphagus sp.]|nr:ADP-ribosylglycohydrolase family protein [Algoriphagus sp.]
MKKLVLLLLSVFAFSCSQQDSENAAPAFSTEVITSSGLTEAALYDRVLGMLVGSALGDAMGAPTEMWTRDAIQLEYGFVKDLDSMIREASPEGIWKANLPAGGTTDDTRWKNLAVNYLLTQQTESLEPKDFASHIFKAYEGSLNKLKNTDGTAVEPFENALQEANWLSEWAKVAAPYRDANLGGYADSLSKFYGGEMVCAGLLYAPAIGAFYPGNPAKAYQEAYRISIFDLGYARDLSALAAALTASGMTPEATKDSLLASLRLDPEGYFQSRLVGRTAHKLLKDAMTIVREAKKLDSLPTSLSLGNPALTYAYTELDLRQQDMPFHSGEIYLQAITAMLFTDFDFQGTLTFLTNYGRDNDTTASLAGGILGAWLGYSRLPTADRERVIQVTRDELGIDLEKQAKRLTLHLLAKEKNK